MVLSYPALPADVLAGKPLTRGAICRTFSDCTSGPRNGLVSGCFPLDPFYKHAPRRGPPQGDQGRHAGMSTGRSRGQTLAAVTAFVSLFAIVGLALYGLPFFYDFMVKEFGWTRAQVTSGNAYSKLVIGPLFGFFAGWFVDRFGSRRLMIVGILLAGLAPIGLGAMTSLAMFYTFYLCNALGYVLRRAAAQPGAALALVRRRARPGDGLRLSRDRRRRRAGAAHRPRARRCASAGTPRCSCSAC